MAAGLNSLEHIKAGRLHGIATLAANRARLAPDVPTMAEAGVLGFAILPWVAMFAHGRTPPETVERLSREVAAAMKRPRCELSGVVTCVADQLGKTRCRHVRRYHQEQRRPAHERDGREILDRIVRNVLTRMGTATNGLLLPTRSVWPSGGSFRSADGARASAIRACSQ
jgi:Tripartite tricarboxylate transporter family receptor